MDRSAGLWEIRAEFAASRGILREGVEDVECRAL